MSLNKPTFGACIVEREVLLSRFNYFRFFALKLEELIIKNPEFYTTHFKSLPILQHPTSGGIALLAMHYFYLTTRSHCFHLTSSSSSQFMLFSIYFLASAPNGREFIAEKMQNCRFCECPVAEGRVLLSEVQQDALSSWWSQFNFFLLSINVDIGNFPGKCKYIIIKK